MASTQQVRLPDCCWRLIPFLLIRHQNRSKPAAGAAVELAAEAQAEVAAVGKVARVVEEPVAGAQLVVAVGKVARVVALEELAALVERAVPVVLAARVEAVLAAPVEKA